jgi:hypothetical protein
MGRVSVTRASGCRVVLVSLAAGCANIESPPGTGPDFEPPSVVERYPAPGAIVPDLDDDAWVRFDEPVQSPRNLERGLDLSPAWDWKFNPRVSGFSVRPREGWRTGVVYRIRIPAGVTDLIRNRTRQVIEWTFSTGPNIPETRIDGIVYDRVTVAGVPDARLLFLAADSVPYSVVSDTGGVYGMRSLPPDEYTVFAFMDQNRNRRLDPASEPWDSASVSLPESNSRFAIDLWMVPPDSTPPRLLSTVAFDSLTLALEFDEPLDPEASLEEAVVTVLGPPGSVPFRVTDLQVGEPASLPRGESDTVVVRDSLDAFDPDLRPDSTTALDTAAARDSLDRTRPGVSPDARRADVSASDSLAADTTAVQETGAAGPQRLQSTELRDRPFPTLVVRLEQPLTEDTFRVRATGIPNLRGLRGGGDTTFVYVAPLPAVAPGADPDSAGGIDLGLDEARREGGDAVPLPEPAEAEGAAGDSIPLPGDSTSVPAPDSQVQRTEPRAPADGDG